MNFAVFAVSTLGSDFVRNTSDTVMVVRRSRIRIRTSPRIQSCLYGHFKVTTVFNCSESKEVRLERGLSAAARLWLALTAKPFPPIAPWRFSHVMIRTIRIYQALSNYKSLAFGFVMSPAAHRSLLELHEKFASST